MIIPHKNAGDNSLKSKFNEKRVKIRLPYLSLIVFILLFLYDGSAFGLITLASAVFHELGHFFAAELCRADVTEVTVYPFGADMKLGRRLLSYKEDIFIASAGAAANFLLAGFSLLLPRGEASELLFACNMTLALTNLMPIEGLDGGGVLRAAVSSLSSAEAADSVMKASSFFSLVIMWGASVYILFVKNGSPSLFVIACALFASLFVRGKTEKSEE